MKLSDLVSDEELIEALYSEYLKGKAAQDAGEEPGQRIAEFIKNHPKLEQYIDAHHGDTVAGTIRFMMCLLDDILAKKGQPVHA